MEVKCSLPLMPRADFADPTEADLVRDRRTSAPRWRIGNAATVRLVSETIFCAAIVGAIVDRYERVLSFRHTRIICLIGCRRVGTSTAISKAERESDAISGLLAADFRKCFF